MTKSRIARLFRRTRVELDSCRLRSTDNPHLWKHQESCKSKCFPPDLGPELLRRWRMPWQVRKKAAAVLA